MSEGEVRRRPKQDVPPTGPTGDPGWYADPSNPGRRRWWTGESWTGAPKTSDKPTTSAPEHRNMGLLLGVVLILLVIGVIVFLATSPPFEFP